MVCIIVMNALQHDQMSADALLANHTVSDDLAAHLCFQLDPVFVSLRDPTAEHIREKESRFSAVSLSALFSQDPVDLGAVLLHRAHPDPGNRKELLRRGRSLRGQGMQRSIG